MPIPDMASLKQRGSIASRYLEAISSCGGQDLNMSGLTMAASPQSIKKWRTPTKLNSSGMTDSTVADSLGSWTTMETRSRSERHKSRRANTPNSGTTATTATTATASEPAIRLGVEDDCSSIDSTSSHRRQQQAARPAHLSLEEKSTPIEDSLRSIGRILKQHPPYPLTRSPARHGLFPKTSPLKRTTTPTQEQQGQQPYDPSDLSQPYGMRRSPKSVKSTASQRINSFTPRKLAPTKSPSAPSKQHKMNRNQSAPNTPASWVSCQSPAWSPIGSSQDGANAPTEVMMNLSSARKFPSRPQWEQPPSASRDRTESSDAGAPTEIMTNRAQDMARKFRSRPQWEQPPSASRDRTDSSDAGAATEIMTNRAQDILRRYPQPTPPPPPQPRTSWHQQSPQQPNPRPEIVIHSLMDDSISNASGSVFGSVLSPEQELLRHSKSSLLDRGSSSVPAASTRLSRHILEQQKVSYPRHPPSVPEEDEALNSSIRVEIGANNKNMHMTPRPPPVFGGRLVTGGPPLRHMHPTTRALQPPPPPPPPPQPSHLPRQEQHPTQQQQQEHRPEPAQDENKNIELPPYEDADKEGKALSNASSNPFTVYKTHQQGMEGVFPKRSFSEASSGWTPISLSDQDPNRSQQRNGKSPIMSVFSKDRLDLSSVATASPIRKMRSFTTTNKERMEAEGAESHTTLNRSKSSSEVIVQQKQLHHHQQQQSPERSVDPIFCPEGSMSFASSNRTHNNDASIFSQSTMQSHEFNGGAEVKRSVIRTWPPPKEDESCVESELVEILESGYERGKRASESFGSSNPTISVQKSTDSEQSGVPNFGPQRWMPTHASNPPNQEFPNSPNHSEEAMWNQMSGQRSEASERSPANKEGKVHGSEKSQISATSSVRDKIRALNMSSPGPKSNEASPSRTMALQRSAWKAAMDNSSQGNNNSNAGDLTSRQMLIMGAHLACMSNDAAEEKKMDDDTASVKSLRERFEYPQSTRQHRDIDVYENDDMSSLRSMLDDDTASVRSLRERFGENSQRDLEIYDDDDDDTASIKSLRERFEGACPAKEVENGISKLRARFEKKPIESRGKIAPQMDSSWMNSDSNASQPPTSIMTKRRSKRRTDRVSKSSLPPNAPPSVQAGDAADGGDNAKAEVSAGTLESRGGASIPTTDAKMSSTHPPESLSNLQCISGEHVGAGEDRAVVNQEDAPVSSPGPPDHPRKAFTPSPQSKSAAIKLDPIFLSSPNRMNNMGVQRRAIAFGVAKEPITPSKDRSFPGPISSPFQSMRDRLNNLSKSRNDKPLALHERRSTARNFSRWSSSRREDKLTPLAAQDSKAQIDQEKIGCEISRVNSYDLTPVAQLELEAISQHERAATVSKTDGRSFDEFFSKTSRLVREKQQQEAKSTTTPRHSNRDVQAGNQRISNPPAGDARPSNRNDIFRSESKAGTPEPPGSHWTAQADKPPTEANFPESNDKKGQSKESEFSDGVTLDLSIADVSNITNPTAIRSKGSKEVDRQSSTSSWTEDIISKKSEASSSQTSEAAAPLIAASMRLLSDDMSGLIRHQNKQQREKKFDARNEKSRTGIGQEDTRGFDEIGWDIQQVHSSFPVQTENLFDIDPKVDDFQSSGWLEFDNNDTAWSDVPRGTADGNAGMESKSNHSSRPTTPSAERALRSTGQLDSSYDIFTKPVASTSHSQPNTPIRPSAKQTTAPIRPTAIPAMASQNAPLEYHRPKTPTREMTSNPTTPPRQAVLSADRVVQPIAPTREPVAASDRHMYFRPATPSREALTSKTSGPDPTTLQTVTPTFHKSVPTRHMLLQNSHQARPRSSQSHESASIGSKKSHPPIYAREEMAPTRDAMTSQNYIAPDFQQPIYHQTAQPVLSPRDSMGHKVPAVTPSPHRSMPPHHEHTQNQHPSYAHQTPGNVLRQDIQNNRPRTPTRQPSVPASILSTSDPDYATIMEARHQMLLSRQRTLQQRRVARESATHALNQYPAASPSTSSAFGGSPPPPQYPRTSAPSYDMPDPMLAHTGAGFFGRTHPEQAQSYTQRPHPGSSYVPSRLTPPEPPFQHPSDAFESRGPPMNSAIRTSEAQLKPRSASLYNKTPPWHPQQSIPGQSFYNKVTTRLGLGSTGESNNTALYAKLSKLKESRMRRNAGRSAPSAHPVEQRQEHHQSMSSGPTMTNSHAWQHHGDTGNRPPRSTMNDLASPFNRQAAPGSSWPDVANYYGSPDDFSASTMSTNKFFEASLEVD